MSSLTAEAKAAKEERALADQCVALLAVGPLNTLDLRARLGCVPTPSEVYRACANDERVEIAGMSSAVSVFRLRLGDALKTGPISPREEGCQIR